MFTLTEGAKEQLDNYFAQQTEIPSIRIYLAGGWGGPQLGLALDEQKDTDDVFEDSGYTFLVDKSLMQTASPITIDASQYGFKVDSSLKMDAGGGCGSCTSC